MRSIGLFHGDKKTALGTNVTHQERSNALVLPPVPEFDLKGQLRVNGGYLHIRIYIIRITLIA